MKGVLKKEMESPITWAILIICIVLAIPIAIITTIVIWGIRKNKKAGK